MTVVSADVLDKTGAYPAEPNVLRKMKSKKKGGKQEHKRKQGM